MEQKLLKAIERLNNFCKEVKEVKERECEAKYDIEAIETILQEIEKLSTENQKLKEQHKYFCPYNFCPYRVEPKEAGAIAAQPIIPEVKPPEVKLPKMEDVKIDPANLAIDIDKLVQKELSAATRRLEMQNFMKGGA